MIKHYILVDKKVKEVKLLEWANWFETKERFIKHEEIGNVYISTVFLGLDHGFSLNREHKPVLFETMAFKKNKKGVVNYAKEVYQERYCTYKEAEEGHERARNKFLKKLRRKNRVSLLA